MSQPKVNQTKIRRNPLILILVLVVLSFAGFQLSIQGHRPVDPKDTSFIEVQIPESSTAAQVANILKENDLISNERVFLGYCKGQGLDDQLKAGNFLLSRSQSLETIVDQLSSGQVQNANITIPEGYTVKQIGELMIQKEICSQQEWDLALQAEYGYDFLGQLVDPNRLEGYLFPDTYAIDQEATAEEIIKLMLNQFDQLWNQKYAKLAKDRGMSLQETLTIASLIEREAKVPQERETISGVIQNRLKIGMPLQIDATVLYSLGKHQEVVTYKDLEVDSPYNTYKHSGLPPGPIACPGEASISAALNPQQHNYYYYVAKGDGSHEFTSTLAEHNQAINKYSQ